MNILYCGDKYISDGLVMSVLSILESTDEKLNIYVMTMSLETETRKYEAVSPKLIKHLEKKLCEKNAESSIKLIDASENFEKDIPVANMQTRFTPCCMLRLYADEIDELPDKLLYLDNDVICRKDFSDFYSIDISNCELLGVRDHYGKWFFGFDYLNSGVLLLNMKKIRETGLFKKCRERCQNKKMLLPDQTSINRLAKSKLIVPRKYNEQRKLRKNTAMQHFTTSFRFFPWFHSVSVKPWQIDRMHRILKIHEYDDLIEKYLKIREDLSNEEGNSDIFLD